MVQYTVGDESSDWTTSLSSLSSSINGNPSISNCDKAMYSLSAVERDISIYRFENHTIGQSANNTTNPILEITKVEY